MKKHFMVHACRTTVNVLKIILGINDYYPTRHHRRQRLVERIIKFNAMDQNPGKIQRQAKLAGH
jgi:hypothetical protein